MFDLVIHKYLRLPYRLHVHVDKKARKPTTTVLLLHGIGNSSAAWDAVVDALPETVRVISIDLLGFGKSPSPRWLKYNTVIQARSVIATLLQRNVRQKLVIVGHSMGSLVAVEIAKRYPVAVKSLILCSPPFYSDAQKKTILPTQNTILKKFYRLVQKHPKKIVGMVPFAAKLKIVGKAFNITTENVDIYMAALESSILDQTGFEDVKKIQKPIHMLYGALDPIIIKKNLETVVKSNPRASLSTVIAGHEMIGNYVPAVVKVIKRS